MKYYKFVYEDKRPLIFRDTSYFIANFITVTFLSYLLLYIPIMLSLQTKYLPYLTLPSPIIIGLSYALYNQFKLKGLFAYKDYIELIGTTIRKIKIPYEKINSITKCGRIKLSSRKELYGYGDNSYYISYGNIGSCVICVENPDELFNIMKEKNPYIKFVI